MNKKSIIFARGVVYLVGIAALAVCIILLPELAREETVEDPASAYLTYPFLIGSYILATPFFIALFQTLKLIQLIDKNKAFSLQSIQTLQHIKICTLIFSALIILAVIGGISVARSSNPSEDVTGFVALGGIGILISSVMSVFVAVLQKLLIDAVVLKTENDLIV